MSMAMIFDSVISIVGNLMELTPDSHSNPVMSSIRGNINQEKRRAMTPDEIYKGVVYQARHDIVEGMHDADIGYVEVKHALQGDDLEILGSEIYRPERGFVVRNHTNHDQIFTVQANDLCDIYGLNSWPGYTQ